MKQEEIYVGIDVAKARVDLSPYCPGGDIWSIDLTNQRFRELGGSLLAVGTDRGAAREATGGLEVPLVSALAGRRCRW